MRNVFVFAFLIVAIWTGLEVVNNGMGGAFGGLFVDLGLARPDEGPEQTAIGRATTGFEAAYDRAESRVDDQVE